MLEIIVPSQDDIFSEQTGMFLTIPETKLQLEHSLIAVRKWESKWHKPFLSSKNNEEKSTIETIDYIRCMTINKVADPNVYLFLPKDVVDKIVSYIQDPMTATWFSDGEGSLPSKGSREVITAEIIYWWMIDLNIPIEFERWHLNQLLTLIRVLNEKHKKPEKGRKKKGNLAVERARLNQQRRSKFGSKG